MQAYAVALLARRRSVLLELTADSGALIRRRVWLGPIVEGRHIVVRAPTAGALPALRPGDAIALTVPVSGGGWRLPTVVVAHAERADGAEWVLDWPTVVERTAGRRHPRVPVTLAARIRKGLPAARPVSSYVVDVSDAGLQFVFPVALRTGETVGVELTLPDGSLSLAAEVRWAGAMSAYPEDPLFRVGAALHPLEPPARRRLLAFLRLGGHQRVEADA